MFALVGKSGTGKSFRAQLIAQKYGIELIVDDGLLIRDQKILVGKSAKREKGILSAMRTALFADTENAKEVRATLESQTFKRILIIGTSVRMVKRITDVLNLPPPHRIIQIEDVATEEEIEAARRARNDEGKHIIPVPAIEVKRTYPHIFFDSVKILFNRSFRLLKNEKFFEKAVVRPEYSKRGRIAISEAALTQMVLHCVNEFDPSLNVAKIVFAQSKTGYKLEVILNVPFGAQVTTTFYELQRYVLNNLERFTGLLFDDVSITIGRVRDLKKYKSV